MFLFLLLLPVTETEKLTFFGGRERDLRPGGREEHPRALQELQAHPSAAGLLRSAIFSYFQMFEFVNFNKSFNCVQVEIPRL
jgi:hypothetical protein